MGNIRYYKVGHKVLNYTYNGNQQLTAVSGYQTRAFQYDDKGNVINNGYHTFNYNSAGQMVASVAVQITIVQFVNLFIERFATFMTVLPRSYHNFFWFF